MSKSFKELSRNDWRIPASSLDQRPTFEALQFGALQRIADATETMAKSYHDLRNRYDNVSASKQRLEEELIKANRKINSLRGVITRMKRQ